LEAIHTDRAPAPAGHYSQAVEHNGLVFVAGQLPMDGEGKPLSSASVGDQTRAVLENIAVILEAAGSGLDRVLQMTLYITDIEMWPDVNEAYAEVLGSHKPARAVVPVKELHHGVALEVQTIAAAGEG